VSGTGEGGADPGSHATGAPRVAILADDLIWSTRLLAHARAAGAEPVHVRNPAGFEGTLAKVDAVIVDLTARAYDGVAALEVASGAGVPALAVGQHDDHELRKRALAAGASRVLAYRKLFEDGPETLTAWLGTIRQESR
jgi:DNA-binding response OmpR family regulator